jgi:hypothetical protein
MRTGELEGMRSIAPTRRSACIPVHMCGGEQRLMCGSQGIFSAAFWASRRVISAWEVPI